MPEERREETPEAKPVAPEADAAPFPDGPPPPPPSTPVRRRSRGVFVIGVLVGLVVAGATGYFGGQAWLAGTYLPRLAAVEKRAQALEEKLAAAPAAPDDMAALDARVAALEGGVAGIHDALSQPPADDGGAALEARVAALEAAAPAADQAPVVVPDTMAPDTMALEQRLAALETRLGSGALAGDIAQFDARTDELAASVGAAESASQALALRVQAVEQQVGERGTAALIIALAQLREAVAGDAPFPTALAAARHLAEGRTEIEALLAELERLAVAGAPTNATLSAAFPALVDAVLKASPAAEAPWYERALARLRGVVTVRRVGADVAGDDPEARVARAEAALAASDLATAVAEMEPLTATPEVAAWLEGARARLAQDALAARLAESVVALASGTAG
jgi:hypothetical protein